MKSESNWPKGLGRANYLRFATFSSGGHFVYWSRTVEAILVESPKATFLEEDFFCSGGHLVYRSGTILAILVGSLGIIPVKFESHWPKASGRVGF